MEKVSIPSHFQEAASIFLSELREHSKSVQAALSKLKQTNVPIEPGEAAALAERFHLIRGGAGFLNLNELRGQATEAEKFFRDKVASADRMAVEKCLLTSAQVIDRFLSSLSDALSTSV